MASAERRGIPPNRSRSRRPTEELVNEVNKILDGEFIEARLEQPRLDRIPQFCTLDFVGDYRPYALRKGHEGIRAMVEGARRAFPIDTRGSRTHRGRRTRVVDMTISGTKKDEWGPLPATGKRAQFDEIGILQIVTVKFSGSVGSLTICRR